MAKIGPVIMSVVGDAFVEGGRILAIIWEGATTTGDTARLDARPPERALLWSGRTDSAQTYQGANFGPHGLHAPYGFELTQLSAGRVLVYLRED